MQWFSNGAILFRDAPDAALPAASTIKLLIAACLIDAYPSEVWKHSTSIPLTRFAFNASNQFYPGTRVGSPISLAALLSYMILQSDNFSANALIDFLRLEHINAFARKLGLRDTRIHGPFYDTAVIVSPLGYTTARDCNSILAYILSGARSGALQARPAYQNLVYLMSAQTDRRFIPDVVNGRATVADKTGEIRGELNDTAIIDPFGQRPLLFTVLAHGDFSVGDTQRYAQAVRSVLSYIRAVYLPIANRERLPPFGGGSAYGY